MTSKNYRQKLGKPKKSNRNAGPPKGEPWVWLTQELIQSPAFRALSGNGLRVLFRILAEHMAHAGTQNGKLVVTHNDFHQYGIRRASIAAAIQEVEAMGFIQVNRGTRFNGHREPSLYRITWLPDLEGSEPTNRWKGIDEKNVEDFKKARSEERSQIMLQRNARRTRQKTAGQ